MPDTIYIYENHKITGPEGYNVDIIISDHGKDINIEGTDNIILKRENGKYIISNNFIEEGDIKRNSVMYYSGNSFSIPKKDIKNLKSGKLNFPIYSQNKEIAYINKFKNSLNINIEEKDYIIPVIIYIAVLSTKLKEKFGRLYIKTGSLNIAGLVMYSLLGISSVVGIGINSPVLSMLSVFIIVVIPIASSAIRKSNIF